MDRWGVLLTRAQPFHKGHINVVKQILEENDKALIIIGSANKEGTERNPFDIKCRLEIVKKSIETIFEFDLDRITIITMNDWSMEDYTPMVKEWGKYFYYSVVFSIGVKSFNLYYNDDKKIVENWFDEILLKRISIKQCDRTKIENAVSSSKIRQAVLDGNTEYINKYVVNGLEYYKYFKETLEKIKIKPSKDFIME